MYEQHTLFHGAHAKKLNAAQLISQVPKEIAAAIGAVKSAGPYYTRSLSEEVDIHSGVVLIEDGHIILHTHPSRGLLFLDVLSRLTFKPNPILLILSKHFGKDTEFLVKDIIHKIGEP